MKEKSLLYRDSDNPHCQVMITLMGSDLTITGTNDAGKTTLIAAGADVELFTWHMRSPFHNIKTFGYYPPVGIFWSSPPNHLTERGYPGYSAKRTVDDDLVVSLTCPNCKDEYEIVRAKTFTELSVKLNAILGRFEKEVNLLKVGKEWEDFDRLDTRSVDNVSAIVMLSALLGILLLAYLFPA